MYVYTDIQKLKIFMLHLFITERGILTLLNSG